jgi:hypothetical protein
MPHSSPSAATKGHRANAPGLRGHSCGDLYPLTIVGVDFGRQWYVLHAVTGEKSPPFTSQRKAEKLAATCASYYQKV